MKHAAIPLRRIITEPTMRSDDYDWPWEYDEFESFVACASEETNEGDEIQRSAIAEHASMQVRSYGR